MHDNPHVPGVLEVICGSMFAGKTEELIRRVKRFQYAKKNILIFKHAIDTRYDETLVVSHNGTTLEAQPLQNPEDIFTYLTQDTDVVVLDEVQFFDLEIVEVVRSLVRHNIRVIVAGLDKDFRGVPFPVTAALLSDAESVTKLSAVCVCCGQPATVSQRLIEGQPGSFNDPIVLVGESESYEPRCRHCHVILDAPFEKYEAYYTFEV